MADIKIGTLGDANKKFKEQTGKTLCEAGTEAAVTVLGPLGVLGLVADKLTGGTFSKGIKGACETGDVRDAKALAGQVIEKAKASAGQVIEEAKATDLGTTVEKTSGNWFAKLLGDKKEERPTGTSVKLAQAETEVKIEPLKTEYNINDVDREPNPTPVRVNESVTVAAATSSLPVSVDKGEFAGVDAAVKQHADRAIAKASESSKAVVAGDQGKLKSRFDLATLQGAGNFFAEKKIDMPHMVPNTDGPYLADSKQPTSTAQQQVAAAKSAVLNYPMP